MSRHDDPREPFIVTERDLQGGFEAVMDSLERLTPGEIDELGRQTDAAEFGHDAYAIGLTQLESGDLDRAKYWLRKAARYGVPGARRVLDELEVHGVVNAITHEVRQRKASPASTETSTGATRSSTAAFGTPDDTSATIAVVADTTARGAVGGTVLPASHESLARGVTSSVPGTIFALTLAGGLTLGPGDGRRILFGRDRNKVHVCLGEDDRSVSRHQGTLEYSGGQWRVRNMGHRPILIDGKFLFPREQPLSLSIGYSQMFVQTPNRQHLLEVFVTGPGSERPVPRHTDATEPPTQWTLTETERLVLVVFAQRYLEREPYPQPLSWRSAAEQLSDLQPKAGWSAKKVERVVFGVRARLSRAGVPGLTREEVGDPIGNTLNHNLIQELLMTTTLGPMDLALIEAA
jgi:hypothetical protein